MRSDNGECPNGFNQNEDGNCFPAHPEGCPSGITQVDDDETGKCIKIKKDVLMEWNLDRMEKLVHYKQEDPDPNTNRDVLNCGDFSGNNIPVGNNDPNNLNADNDGIGCDKDQDNQEVPQPVTVIESIPVSYSNENTPSVDDETNANTLDDIEETG